MSEWATGTSLSPFSDVRTECPSGLGDSAGKLGPVWAGSDACYLHWFLLCPSELAYSANKLGLVWAGLGWHPICAIYNFFCCVKVGRHTLPASLSHAVWASLSWQAESMSIYVMSALLETESVHIHVMLLEAESIHIHVMSAPLSAESLRI